MSEKANGTQPLVLNFRSRNSGGGVTRKTWKEVAEKMGLTETQAIHVAMSEVARRMGVIERGDGNLPLPSAAEISRLDRDIKGSGVGGETLETRSLLGEVWESLEGGKGDGEEPGMDP